MGDNVIRPYDELFSPGTVSNTKSLAKEDMQIVENVLSQEQIDELRRYETAKEFMSIIMGRANFDPINAPIMCCSCSGEKINPYSYIATISVQAADALLEALKGKGETDEVREQV